MRRFLAVLVGIAGVAALTATLEFTYRYARLGSFRLPARTWVEDPDLIYKLNPGRYSDSFWGRTLCSEGDASVLIVCLGGSATMGHGVKPDEAWPAVLARVLETRGICADVINAGVSGYGTRQLLSRYRREIAPMQPDLVVVYTGWNRTGALVDPEEWVPFGIRRPGDSWGLRAREILGNRSLTVRHAIRGGMILKRKLQGGAWRMDPYHEVYVQDLRNLVLEITKTGHLPLLIIYPALYYDGIAPDEIAAYEPMLWPGERFRPDMLTELRRKHQAIRTVAAATAVPSVDVQELFRKFTGRERAALFLDEMHPSIRGHQQIGEIIGTVTAELILETGLHAKRTARSGADSGA